ncbi:DUF3810 domain-containing protein [Mangrovimonas cancribranchiae]|uniref:DUF3810 domain-containing protein n=1 Tax=Mangrovimonas cancribranchiae TaxID=3080055 RepID=A0AAU6P3H3_9FLAO
MPKNKKLLVALSILPQILLMKWLSTYPNFVESYYSEGVYPYISKLFRYVFGWLPFSFGDIFYAFAIIYMLRWLILNIRRVKYNFKGFLIDVFSAISMIYLAFHVLWGLNYYRLPLHENLNINADYTTEELISTTEKFIVEANTIHLSITQDSTQKVVSPYANKEVFKKVPEGFHQLKTEFPSLDYYPKSIKNALFSLPLTYMGFSGYLNPLTGEAHVDYLVPSFKIPMISSHEVAHQLGFAAENEANFIGVLAATKHPDKYFKYSGTIFALKHCLVEVYRRDPDTYEVLKTQVNVGILKNYQELQEFWDGYENPFESIFKTTYDGFLKVNNQTDGMKSYSYVVALLVNYFENQNVKAN